MATSFKEIFAAIPKEEQQAITEEAEQIIAQDMTLQELRKLLQFSQKEVSEGLNVNQAEVSKMERRSDMYLSTLRSYLKVLGCELAVYANFPDRPPVKINQFVEKPSRAERRSGKTHRELALH